jgi:HSP20 family molecular chaperone IbpA
MFLTTTRRPLDGFQALRRLGNVLDEAFESGAITSAWHPAVDIFEDKDAVKIMAELPGVKPEDVKLSLENNLLTIRGEKKQEAEERNERVHRYERSYGSFSARSCCRAPWMARRSPRSTAMEFSPSPCRRRSGPVRGRFPSGQPEAAVGLRTSVFVRSPLRGMSDCRPAGYWIG